MTKFENFKIFAFFLTNSQIFSKMGKRKGDKENPASLSKKKGHEKGLSNIIHVHRNDGKVVTQAEVHFQPESHSQEPQPESHSQKTQPEAQSQELQAEAQESQTSEPQIQKEQYPLTLNQAINLRYTGGLTNVLDTYKWHTCSDICKTLDFENLYYKYLHQDICPLIQSDWILKTYGDLADWRAAVVTGKEESFNSYKERLSVVEKISSHESYDSVLKHLKNQMNLEKTQHRTK